MKSLDSFLIDKVLDNNGLNKIHIILKILEKYKIKNDQPIRGTLCVRHHKRFKKKKGYTQDFEESL